MWHCPAILLIYSEYCTREKFSILRLLRRVSFVMFFAHLFKFLPQQSTFTVGKSSQVMYLSQLGNLFKLKIPLDDKTFQDRNSVQDKKYLQVGKCFIQFKNISSSSLCLWHVKDDQIKPNRWKFVFFISRILSIGSSKFMCLSPHN